MMNTTTAQAIDELQKRVRSAWQLKASAHNGQARWVTEVEETVSLNSHEVTFRVGRPRVSHACKHSFSSGVEGWKLDGKRSTFTNVALALAE